MTPARLRLKGKIIDHGQGQGQGYGYGYGWNLSIDWRL